MTIKFDQVEVFKLRQYSNTASVHTKKVYPIDSFELERKNKRRTIAQFHRSDLYREEIWIAKQKKAQGERQIVQVDENIRDDISSSSPSEKIRKIDNVKKTKQRNRRNHLFQRQKRKSSLESSLKSSLMPIRESTGIVF
mmetsp:Transcript_15566/g.22129  ORF Transcript_15566/g.22129 Transcript_15566/m.22129 type:complete len:139 (+) Transcript_15566:55-471(+)